MAWSSLFIILIIIHLMAYVWFSVRKRFQYWQKRNVPFVKPNSLIFGNCKDFILGRVTCNGYSLYLYEELGDCKFGGFFNFHQPCLLIKDPFLIKRILVQDSQYFPHRSPHYIPKGNPLQNNLLQMPGNSSREARKKLTPGFSLSRMKNLFGHAETRTIELLKMIDHSIDTKESICMKNLLARYFMDVSSSWMFGLEPNALHEGDSDFVNMGRKFFESRFSSALSITWSFLAHRILRFIRIPKETVSFYDRVIKKEILCRDKNGIFRNDVLNIMMNLRTTKIGDENLVQSENPLGAIDMELWLPKERGLWWYKRKARIHVGELNSRCIVYLRSILDKKCLSPLH